MREDILKKNMHTQLTTWKTNANIKNLPPPPPPITFLMVRPLLLITQNNSSKTGLLFNVGTGS